MSTHKKYSIEEMQAQIRQLQTTINLPGVPDDEKAIYNDTIQRIQAEIAARQAAPNPQPHYHEPKPIPQPKPEAQLPPIGGAGGGIEEAFDRDAAATNEHYQRQATTTPPKPEAKHPTFGGAGGGFTVRTAGGHTHTATALPATIEVQKDTDPHNPSLTIRWADDYTITVDETAARGRFATTLRDTISLKCVSKEHRFEKMWRWDTPWRAAGFYQALIHFYGGEPPTLQQLDIKRPSELTRYIFSLIADAAAIAAEKQ